MRSAVVGTRAWVAIALGRFPAVEAGDIRGAAVLARLREDADPYVREQAKAACGQGDLRLQQGETRS